jgi:hypothetical protein
MERQIERLDFVNDGFFVRARLYNPQEGEVIIGTILSRVCAENPEILKRFVKLMSDTLSAAVVSIYGPGANPRVVVPEEYRS